MPRALGSDGSRSCLRHCIENLSLVRGVALHCRYQIRHQISAALQLDIDVRPGVLGDSRVCG